MTATPAMRIGGWLLVPLAWLLMTLLGKSLGLLIWLMPLMSSQIHQVLSAQGGQHIAMWYFSLAIAILFWSYTLWLIVAFFNRRVLVRKHYIIWLLVCVLLALKAFAFSPVSDALAVRQLVYPLIAAALLAPYFRRSQRVKATFVNP